MNRSLYYLWKAICAAPMPPPGELELPESHVDSIMAKAAGHKYIKRVLTGKAKPKYRYYYTAHAGNGVHAHEHMVAGSSFRHNGGHWHIKHTDGDHLHIHHDESGETKVVTKHELSNMLKDEHGKALAAHEAKQAQDKADVREHGSDAQRKRAGLPTKAEEAEAKRKADEDAKRKADEAAAAERKKAEPVDTTKIHELQYGEKEDGSNRGHEPGEIFQDGKGGPYYVAVARKEGKRLSRREMSDNEDFGHYGIRAFHTVHARRATPEEEATLKAWQERRDAHNKAAEAAKYGRGGSFADTAKAIRQGSIVNGPDRNLSLSPTAERITNPANPQEQFIIDKDGGAIHHESYSPGTESYYSYTAPYNDTLAGWARNAAQSVPIGPFKEPRPKVAVPGNAKPEKPKAPSVVDVTAAAGGTPTATPQTATPAGRLSYDDIRSKLETHPKVTFSGNTFDHKDAIKDLGGKWDPDRKAWTLDTKRTKMSQGRRQIEGIERLAAKRGLSATFHKGNSFIDVLHLIAKALR